MQTMTNTKTTTTETNYNRAKLWQIILFTFNNTSTNCYLFAVMFITYYATGVVGLAALLISSVMGLIRFFDGVIDPAIGVFIDKLETKYGKFRPVIIVGNIISILSFILLFSTHKLPMSARLAVLVVALVIHKIGYSLQASVTKAGQTVLTNDPKQRPLFGIFDGIFNIGVFTGGQILVSSVLVKKYGGFSEGLFKEFSIIIMVLSFVLAILAAIGIGKKDKKEYFGLGEATTKTKGFKDYWKVIKGNRPLQMLCLSAAADKLALTLFSDSVATVMLFGIVLGNYALSGQISALSIIPDLAITFAATAIARKAGLKKSFTICIALAMISLIAMGGIVGFATPGTISMTNINFITVLFILLYSVAKSLSRTPSTLVITMTADVSDYETSKSGRYVAGMIGTVFSFIDTLVSSLGPVIIGWICATIGFAQAFPTVKTPMSASIRTGTLIALCIVPAVLMIISLLGMKLYPLDDKAMEKVQADITAKKNQLS
jgi:Na+/melibiose symporter-like transporter